MDDFRNDTGTYQTGRTQPPRHHQGLLAFLLILVILLSGISTALSVLNMKLYRKLSATESSAPVAFSRSEKDPLPTEAVHEEVRALQEHLGISGTMIPVICQRYYKLPNGVYVTQVSNDSEAQQKGILAGDIITAMNGHTIKAPEDLSDGFHPGDSVELTLYRSGSELTLTLTWCN